MRRLLGCLASAVLGLYPWPARPQRLQIAPEHSRAEFSVRLFWIHTVDGRFTGITGSVQPLPDGSLRVDARIAVASLVMHSARIRRWVLAPEFFDAAHYPGIRFVSRPLSPATLQRGGSLDGELTLRGTTRPVRFELAPAQCARLASSACLITARGQVRRSDFGMTGHHTVLSDTVTLALLIRLEPAPTPGARPSG